MHFSIAAHWLALHPLLQRWMVMENAASIASVSIKKISGDVHPFTAEAGETVDGLKVRLADQLSAPAMCQRWLMETPSQLASEHSIRCITMRMDGLLSELERSKLQDLMAIHRPPQIMEDCFDVIMDLIRGNEELKEEMQHLRRTTGADRWRAIARIASGRAPHFVRALESFPDDVRHDRVKPQAIQSAKAKLQQLGNALLPARMKRVSQVACILSRWVKLALKFCDTCGVPTLLELDDCVELAGCQGGGEELCLSLVVDLEPALSHLMFPVGVHEELEAVNAVKVVGHSDPQGCIRLLAPRIFYRIYGDQDLGAASADAVLSIYDLKDDADMPELLLKELQDFLDGGHQRPFGPVLRVLQRVPTGNQKVLEWMLYILCKGVQEEQEIALDRFNDLQQHFGQGVAANLVMDRLFCLKDPAKWHELDGSGEKFLMKALAEVCEPEAEGTATVHSELMKFLEDDDSRKVVRAAQTVAALGADEVLQGAVRASLESESAKGTDWAVLDICTSLVKISEDTKPQVFEALLREVRRKRNRNCEEILKTINQCGPLDGTLQLLACYLKHAKMICKHEGVGPLLEAFKLADFYCKTFNLPEAKELKATIKAALAQGIAGSGDKKCAQVLPEIVDFEGEGEGVLDALVSGLRHPNPKVRQLCEDVFLQVVQPDDPKACEVLIRNIADETVTLARCWQIKLLGDVSPRNHTEVINLLLLLADDANVCIRSSALAQLWACADRERCIEVLRSHVEEKDEQVRLASLTSIFKLEEDLGALQSLCLDRLKDDASSVVLLSLMTLIDRCAVLANEEDCCTSLAPLLSHGDAKVREAACKVLGKMKQDGCGRAESLLDGKGLEQWPEKSTTVLEARRRALGVLRGDFQDDYDYDAEE